MPRTVLFKNKRGIPLEFFILLCGALVGLALYFSPSPGEGGASSASANQDVGASVVIQQSSQFYDAMIQYLNFGGSQNMLTIDSNGVTGIFTDALGTGKKPVAHPGFFDDAGLDDSKWFLNRNFSLGSPADPWSALVLPNLKKPLCQKLNTILHRDALNAEPVESVYSKEQWISGTVVLGGADSRLARRDGCAAAKDGRYVFYRVMIRS